MNVSRTGRGWTGVTRPTPGAATPRRPRGLGSSGSGKSPITARSRARSPPEGNHRDSRDRDERDQGLCPYRVLHFDAMSSHPAGMPIPRNRLHPHECDQSSFDLPGFPGVLSWSAEPYAPLLKGCGVASRMEFSTHDFGSCGRHASSRSSMDETAFPQEVTAPGHDRQRWTRCGIDFGLISACMLPRGR